MRDREKKGRERMKESRQNKLKIISAGLDIALGSRPPSVTAAL